MQMENRNTIINELQNLSPVVAQVAPVNPYRLPEGYFEHLPAALLSMVKGEEVSLVVPAALSDPYSVPDGYFEKLPELMLEKVKSGFVLTDKQNPYAVPEGYFDGLPDVILNKVKASEASTPKEELDLVSSVLGSINKQNPYSLPAGYFDDLAGNIAEGAKAIDLVNQELENLSPLMSNLKHRNVYEVPAGYFEKLPETVLATAREQKPAKVVSIKFGRKLMRYAAAAAVTGVLVVAGWFYSDNSKKLTIKDISDTELQEYVESQNSVVDVATSSDTDNFELTADDVKDMLAEVSDEELQQYISTTN